MIFDRLFGRRGNWPKGIPQLYPELVGPELCNFLSRKQHMYLMGVPLVMICPFFSNEEQDESFVFLGAGLSRRLIRDLMLVKNLSIRGPEDTAQIPCEMASELSQSEHKDATTVVTGRLQYEDVFRLNFQLWRQGKVVGEGVVQCKDVAGLLADAAESIAIALGGKITDDIRPRWRHARPESLEELLMIGRLFLSGPSDESEQKNDFITQCIERFPQSAMLHAEMTGAENLHYLLKAQALDPFDAQTCFSLFIATWKSNGKYEPYAVQFLRRAIELSPGHGKAHMCSPHAAHHDMQPLMITHSQLGYRLLPGNCFAIENYIINLQCAGAPHEKLVKLCKEGIAADPQDPGNYERLIDLCVATKDYETALVIAEELQKLFEPKMNERAYYCLKQNPERARQLDDGTFDPIKENRKRIARLRAACNK